VARRARDLDDRRVGANAALEAHRRRNDGRRATATVVTAPLDLEFDALVVRRAATDRLRVAERAHLELLRDAAIDERAPHRRRTPRRQSPWIALARCRMSRDRNHLDVGIAA
jgi:hypothetical protein